MTADHTVSSMEQLEVHRIELDDQGYDDNGSYWGTGTPLFWVTTPDGKHDCFVRADDALRARLTASEEIPLLAWERDQAEIDRNAPTVVEPEHLSDGIYGFPDSEQTPTLRRTLNQRGAAPRHSGNLSEQAGETARTSPARPAGKAGGSGPAGQAGPT